MTPATSKAASCQFMSIHLCLEHRLMIGLSQYICVWCGLKDRLAKSDWIEHGLRTLANEGANALKVGPMSTKLKVSRGSFYWHFRDIADFRSQLLRSWQEISTDQVIQDLDAREGEPDRLKHLTRRAFGGTRNLDRAIWSWAAEDKDVAR